MSNPNQIVAERITAALAERKVLLPDSTKGLTERLASGQIGASDWVTLFGLDEKKREQDAKIEDQKH